MGANTSRERAIADSQFGSGTPATWYIGVSTTASNNDGSGFTEPVGAAYARVAVPNNAVNWPAAATVGGVTEKRNGTKVTFPNPTGNWGGLVEWGAFLNPTGGLPEWSNKLDATVTPKSGNTPVEFDVGQLLMTWQ